MIKHALIMIGIAMSVSGCGGSFPCSDSPFLGRWDNGNTTLRLHETCEGSFSHCAIVFRFEEIAGGITFITHSVDTHPTCRDFVESVLNISACHGQVTETTLTFDCGGGPVTYEKSEAN